MHNFVHIEIKVTDFEQAKIFYGSIFKWKIYSLPEMENVLFYRPDEEDEQVGGAFLLTNQIPAESSIMLYINSKNVDQTLQEIESKGGQIVLGMTELPGGHGFIGRFRDPFGNLMGLWSEE
ncbi:MAG: VOC family protein [Candidatus Hodarchaeales archaeon]